ncbi:hypothetical protein JI739_18780 [Ramlibacter sp. AW1]|jgi:hypothetical protein|uniref:Uncharacterized protein n=1 Tax=Ramlibacter aurantiacus TaxID=2801330 RepID=A0A936ZRM1_9BURK|nr:hypothetical protein [Ramlibacter aurantiacus]MBL0422401.1 hypothetical protein [Ramlibacter aurantiacus]
MMMSGGGRRTIHDFTAKSIDTVSAFLQEFNPEIDRDRFDSEREGIPLSQFGSKACTLPTAPGHARSIPSGRGFADREPGHLGNEDFSLSRRRLTLRLSPIVLMKLPKA